MEINSVRIPYKHDGERFQIIPLGDIHYGNWQCDTDYIEKLIDWIRKEHNTYVLGMGDYCDCITPNDERRFDLDSAKEFRPAEQYDYIYKQFYKIKDKLLGLHIGHHGDNLRLQLENHDLELAKKLETRYLDWQAFTILNFVRNNRKSKLTIYSTHGHGGGGTTGAKINKVEDLAKFYDADIYLMGHLHKCLTATDSLVGIGTGKYGSRLVYPKRIYGITGTMLRYPIEGKSGYEARKGYRPMKPGVIKIKLYPEVNRDGKEQKDMHISE